MPSIDRVMTSSPTKLIRVSNLRMSTRIEPGTVNGLVQVQRPGQVAVFGRVVLERGQRGAVAGDGQFAQRVQFTDDAQRVVAGAAEADPLAERRGLPGAAPPAVGGSEGI